MIDMKKTIKVATVLGIIEGACGVCKSRFVKTEADCKLCPVRTIEEWVKFESTE